MIFEKSCGAVVFRNGSAPNGDKQRYVLMIKQSSRSNYSFPKGHVEGDESEIETAVREVFEETSVKITIRDPFRQTVNYSPRPGARKEVVYFTALTDAESIHPQEGEIKEVKWVAVEHAKELLAHSNDKKVFAMALEYINRKCQ